MKSQQPVEIVESSFLRWWDYFVQIDSLRLWFVTKAVAWLWGLKFEDDLYNI